MTRPLAIRGGARAAQRGMTTAEYAVGTVAACGLAGLLIKILTSNEVRELLFDVIRRAFAPILG